MGPVNPGLKSVWSTLSHDPGGWMPVPSPVYFRSGTFSVCWARNVRCCCNVHRYWIDFWKPLHSMLFNGHWLYSIGERETDTGDTQLTYCEPAGRNIRINDTLASFQKLAHVGRMPWCDWHRYIERRFIQKNGGKHQYTLQPIFDSFRRICIR